MDQNNLDVEVKLNKIGKCPVCGKGQMLQGAAGWTCDYFRTLEDKCTFTIFQNYNGYDLTEEDALDLVCGKGQMLQGAAGWTCDYFRTLEDKCTFTIFQNYNGYDLTEEDALDLITKGQTGIRNFMTREGKPFRGILKRTGDKVKVARPNDLLPIPCPHCEGKVREVENGYVCEAFFRKDDEHCGFWLPKTVSERPIRYQEALDLMQHGRTEVLDGFKSHGKEYSSCLTLAEDGTVLIVSERPIRYQEALDLMQHGRTEVLDGFKSHGKEYSSCLTLAEDGTVLIDGRICKCPKCGGTVYAGIKGYNCSNFRNPAVRCDFVIWRVIGKRKTTVDDVRMLCTQGKTGILTFYTMDNEAYEKSLVLDSQFKVRME